MDIPLPTACTEIAFALNSKIVKLHQTGPIRRVTMKPYLASVAYLQSISREFDDVSASVMSFFELQIVLCRRGAGSGRCHPGSLRQRYETFHLRRGDRTGGADDGLRAADHYAPLCRLPAPPHALLLHGGAALALSADARAHLGVALLPGPAQGAY